MNTAILHTVTEEFAAYLSEVTDGDLGLATPCAGWTVVDLYRHVVEENAEFGHAVSGLPVPAGAKSGHRDTDEMLPSRCMGGGFDEIYRTSARYMEQGFDAIEDPGQLRQVAGVPGERRVADLLEMQIADTLIHTWDLAQAIGFDYEPRPEIARLVLQRMGAIPDAARGDGKAFGHAQTVADAERLSTLDRLLLLSGRDLAWRSSLKPGGGAA